MTGEPNIKHQMSPLGLNDNPSGSQLQK